MSPSSWILWTLVWTAWILSSVESVDPNQSEQDNQEVFDEMLQFNSNHPEIQDLDLSEDQMGDGAVAPMGPITETAPSTIVTPSHTLVQTQTHTPPLLQPQPQLITQTPAQPQTVMIVPAATPSHHFIQSQVPSTAPVHTAPQQVPTLMSCNTLTAGAGAVTAGTGGAVKEGKRWKTHSINEKRYRSSINDKIQELRDLLNIDPKVPKSGVLQKAIEYIESSQVNHKLQQENLTLETANQNNTLQMDPNASSVPSVTLEQILQEFFDEAELLAYSDDGGVNNSEHNGSDSQVITLPAEETLQEDVVGTESRHEPDNVTRPSHGPSLEEGTNTSLATSPQCTGGQGVKRRRLPEEDEVDDSPSTRRLRTSENNEQDYDEEGLTAWSDSLVHASDQVSFSNPESELPHEIPRELFRDHNLNRRLDYNMLSHVNRYFERLFNLAGQPPSYPEAEDIVAGALSMRMYISEDVREQRVEQRLVANALLLIGERLNLIQRMLMELYSHMMRRP
ncbi:sterol regulatory element-binding protein 2-like [Onychostoma macrolepis]|uniref:sterol regulatory element-binding protein 2-like n=1 Tax=Onychostoma macrolepis TaxID=369639 RepID=UPI00272B6C08|nr:sterol regulatory element-binding protein 2-like [Onychostoma macrolepis]